MGVQLVFHRHVVLDGALDRLHRLTHGHARTVAEAEDMGVDRLRGMAEPHVQHHVRGLAPDTGQLLHGQRVEEDLLLAAGQKATGQEFLQDRHGMVRASAGSAVARSTASGTEPMSIDGASAGA